MEKKRCPYLEIVTMTFCTAYPIKKLVPLESMKESSPCFLEHFYGCSLYRNTLHNQILDVVRGFELEKGLYYHEGHMWMRPEGNNIRIGLDDFSRRLLSPITGINLPLIGTEMTQGENVVSLRCGPRLADMFSPINGKVVDVHDGLFTNPELIEKDTYGQGWMLLVHPSGDNPLKEAFFGESARKWFEEDIERYHRILEAELGITETDGGEPVSGLSAKLDEIQWNRLMRLFFTERKEG